MDDLISRQAVIEINRSYHGYMPNEVNHRIWKEINELPSAQPEKRTEERTETHACDCIERQAAIAYAISGRIRTLTTSEDGENWIRTEEVRQSLLNMPSAPQRTGRWIHDGCQFEGGIDWMHCSECGHKDIWNAVRTPFCAWCGARMEGE